MINQTHIKTGFLAALLLILTSIETHALAAPSIPEDQSKAVILAYHRIGEDSYPDTNLRTEQFLEHLQEIKQGNYNVIALPELLNAFENKEKLPPRTIAITFEGAYRSAFENAIPHLLDAEVPFTVFYASNNAEQNRPSYVDWETLKSLHKNKTVTLGTLPASYSRITHDNEQDVLITLNKARIKHREHFNEETDILSYPFGEYSQNLRSLAKQQGFKAALGLHSGASFPGSDIYALPRFSMTENYGNIERFRFVTNALPLPVTSVEPQNPDITGRDFAVGFTLPETLKDAPLSCFMSGQEKPNIERLGTRIEIRSKEEKQQRTRLNCTMQGPKSEEGTSQWRWFSLLLHRRPETTSTNQQLDELQ